MRTFRASSLDRVLFCNGSPTLEEIVGNSTLEFDEEDDEEVGGHAITWAGNWCHATAGQRLIDESGAIGKIEPPEVPAGWQPTGYDEYVVSWYVNNVLELTPPNWMLFVEQACASEFNYGPVAPFRSFQLTGHIDCYGISPDLETAVINDLKRGQGHVDAAESNWQLAAYIALLKRRHPSLKTVIARLLQAGEEITEVVVTADNRTVRSWVPSCNKPPQDLEKVTDFLVTKIANAIEHWNELTTGENQCKYCPAKELCASDPRLALYQEIEFMKTLLSPETIASLKGVVPLAQLAEVALRARAIAYPGKVLVDTMTARLAAEGPIELDNGTQLSVVEEPGNRVVNDVRQAVARAQPVIGDEVWNILKMRLGKDGLEDKLAATGMKRSSKKPDDPTAKRWIETELIGMIDRPMRKKLVIKEAT